MEKVQWVSEAAGIAYDRMSSAEVSGKHSMGAGEWQLRIRGTGNWEPRPGEYTCT